MANQWGFWSATARTWKVKKVGHYDSPVHLFRIDNPVIGISQHNRADGSVLVSHVSVGNKTFGKLTVPWGSETMAQSHKLHGAE